MTIIPGTDMYVGLSGVNGKPDEVPAHAVFLNQTHSNRIAVNPRGGENADGMVMQRGFSIPALRVADCLPVFAVWDDYIGAAHAGWRGLAAGIIENLINSVDLPLKWLVLGPCICGNCYSVGEDVYEAVTQVVPERRSVHNTKRLDLRASAFRRASDLCSEQFGLINIEECTMESTSLYSYRRNATTSRNILWLAETERGEHIPHLNSETEIISPERRKN